MAPFNSPNVLINNAKHVSIATHKFGEVLESAPSGFNYTSKDKLVEVQTAYFLDHKNTSYDFYSQGVNVSVPSSIVKEYKSEDKCGNPVSFATIKDPLYVRFKG